jgi:hypothetical protein
MIYVFEGCGPITINKPNAEKPVAIDSVNMQSNSSDSVSTADTLKYMQAYGDLYFGMKRAAVEQKNKEIQKLGKYEYNFSYCFNGDSMLYKVIIKSDGIKVINYDSDLKNLYRNLYQIIETRYGEPAKRNEYPSIFDVQQTKKYTLDRWQTGSKQINLALNENAMNNYSVLCEILDSVMFKTEQKRLKDLKNRDITEAAEKF